MRSIAAGSLQVFDRHCLTTLLHRVALCALTAGLAISADAATPRARDLGVPFPGTPGEFNAITDVKGVEVGQTTLIRGDVGTPAPIVRTGVTIVHPLGKRSTDAVAAGFAVINGTGEFTGTRMIDETGLLLGPIALTGTANIPTVSQALMDWASRPGYLPKELVFTHFLPVVGETLDARLNDIFQHSLQPGAVLAALDGARSGWVAEGNVGGGTGMQAYQFKGGIGTASRVAHVAGHTYTVGVLLQANNGRRADLRIAGIPIGEEVHDLMPERAPGPHDEPAKNSLLVLVATDAPLQVHQLRRLARRVSLGVGRDGNTAGSMSGEFALAFSTTNTTPLDGGPPAPRPVITDLDGAQLDALFEATVQATEEAVVNQLVASDTMVGVGGYKVYGLPHNRLVQILKAHSRLSAPIR
jgi:L-aminopeptidase/D-esterase-like protein